MPTFYPSPFGSYNDMEIDSNLTVVDDASSEQVRLSADPGGNITINASEPWYQIAFDDRGTVRDYCFLQRYRGSVPRCPSGFARMGIYDSSRRPVEGWTPNPGYILCVRGTE